MNLIDPLFDSPLSVPIPVTHQAFFLRIRKVSTEYGLETEIESASQPLQSCLATLYIGDRIILEPTIYRMPLGRKTFRFDAPVNTNLGDTYFAGTGVL